MTEIEVPLEKVQEHIQETAMHEHGGLFTHGAMLSALLAVLAAISALLAGQNANDAMIDEIQAANQWSYYQAKSIKAAVLEGRRDTLTALGKAVPGTLEEKLGKYREDQAKIQASAREKEESSVAHLHQHETLAKGVTLFQVAIALTAIAMLVRRRSILAVAAVLGLVGAVFFVLAHTGSGTGHAIEEPSEAAAHAGK